MKKKKKDVRVPREPRDDEVEIFSAKRTLPNGRIQYAHEVGLKAFRFLVKKEDKKRMFSQTFPLARSFRYQAI